MIAQGKRSAGHQTDGRRHRCAFQQRIVVADHDIERLVVKDQGARYKFWIRL